MLILVWKAVWMGRRLLVVRSSKLVAEETRFSPL